MTGQEKGDLLINTGDCLIEVTTWTGFTVICVHVLLLST